MSKAGDGACEHAIPASHHVDRGVSGHHSVVDVDACDPSAPADGEHRTDRGVALHHVFVDRLQESLQRILYIFDQMVYDVV